MFNVGPGELIGIFGVALIVLGPNRLPGAVRTAGKVVGELRRMSTALQDEVRRAVEVDEPDEAEDPTEPQESEEPDEAEDPTEPQESEDADEALVGVDVGVDVEVDSSPM